ncbi:hypothetical protein DM02DRAFT_438937 [Periconia macrospinosa]|uniref:DUF7514 domain-containing protein n=1 Tax=Periconia macrospinosa TaxID=97972 RepID=A0A2V1DPZ0_9PLEO|nr:hypothetical protein DM02DRAFT_438937 [Periconia macrospinosa]
MDYHSSQHHQQTHFSPHHAYYSTSYPQDTEPRRPSSPSSSESFPPFTQQPLNNALNNAFDKSDSASRVDPELIAQITAEVKKSVLEEIKMSAMSGTNPPPPQSFPSSTTSLPPRNVYTPPSPKHSDPPARGSPSPGPATNDIRDSTFDGTDDIPTPRYEQNHPVNSSREQTAPRPVPPRMSTEESYTPIEKMWQRLFDLQGQPTDRLSQFLRGLAVHLIEDYEPKNSLVISPSKLMRFYQDVKIDEEIYPWDKIFGELPYSTLSKIYRDLRCQHHLIQEHSADQPHIPALTPDGFREWMTIMIQAYPSNEYARLSKAVLDMPISNADDRKERFPKELPRRLFPHEENLHAQQRCAAALSAEGVGPLRRAPTFPPPPPKAQPSNVPSGLERERSPYTNRRDTGAVESDEEREEPISRPIERERKPYSAAPGGGKVYNDEHRRSVPLESTLHEQRRRTQSTASQNPWVPPPTMSQPTQQSRATAQPAGRRQRSPSISNKFAQSDSSLRDVPSNYYNQSRHDVEETNRTFDPEAERRRNERSSRHAEANPAHHRRSTAGTDSSYDSQPRSVYDDDYYRSCNSANGYESRGYDGGGYDSRRY